MHSNDGYPIGDLTDYTRDQDADHSRILAYDEAREQACLDGNVTAQSAEMKYVQYDGTTKSRIEIARIAHGCAMSIKKEELPTVTLEKNGMCCRVEPSDYVTCDSENVVEVWAAAAFEEHSPESLCDSSIARVESERDSEREAMLGVLSAHEELCDTYNTGASDNDCPTCHGTGVKR